jgi:hypothetical protein
MAKERKIKAPNVISNDKRQKKINEKPEMYKKNY